MPRHRCQQGHVVNALQRPEILLQPRGAAADEQHRHPFQMRMRHRRHGVGHPRSRRHHGHTQAVALRCTQHGVGVRHVDGSSFVAHVDDAHPQPRQPVPDWLDVAALQPIDAVDTAVDEKAGYQLGDSEWCMDHD